MAIKHTAVSYYGLNYVEHAEKDFTSSISEDALIASSSVSSIYISSSTAIAFIPSLPWES